MKEVMIVFITIYSDYLTNASVALNSIQALSELYQTN